MAYNLEGSLLEVCDCDVLCPCWIGENPDNGTCQSALAYQIDNGAIDGVDVSGLTYAIAAFIRAMCSRATSASSATSTIAPAPSRRRRYWRRSAARRAGRSPTSRS